jgi:hypothetical protein
MLATGAFPPRRTQRGTHRSLLNHSLAFIIRLNSLVEHGPLGIGKNVGTWAGSIELLGEARDEALEQLVRLAKQPLGTKSITLLGPKDVRERLTEMASERGLEIAQERQR